MGLWEAGCLSPKWQLRWGKAGKSALLGIIHAAALPLPSAVPQTPGFPASAHRHGPSSCCPWAQFWLPLRQSGSCQSYPGPRLSGPHLGLPGRAPTKTSAGGRQHRVFWLGARRPDRLLIAAHGQAFARRLMEWRVLGVKERVGVIFRD